MDEISESYQVRSGLVPGGPAVEDDEEVEEEGGGGKEQTESPQQREASLE